MPFRDADGKIIRWFGTNTGISEQKAMQEELREIAAKLSEADRRKDAFLATLAHELRNPLAPVCTGLEIMKIAKDDPATMEEVRATMERQTKQLVALIDDLMDVSRITRGKLQLRKCRVALADVVHSAVEAAKPILDECAHQLALHLPQQPIYLDADPNRMAQVFSNLLNNAAKYTPEGGQVSLTAEPQGGDVVVSIKDNGIGVPADMLEQIFEMFTQIEHPIEKNYPGLGIGLTLVKSLVEMHGGGVKAESGGPGQGSVFSVRLPIFVEAPDQRTLLAADASKTSSEKRRVLVVDDNLAAANMLSMIVKMLGNEVRTANDGQHALEVAEEFLPDMVVMDLGMPRMNGYEAAKHLRQQPWGRQVMLVALTGWGQEEDKRRTKEAGFDYHLVKPAEPAAIQAILAEMEKGG